MQRETTRTTWKKHARQQISKGADGGSLRTGRCLDSWKSVKNRASASGAYFASNKHGKRTWSSISAAPQEVRRHRVGAYRLLSLASDVITFSGLRNASLTYLKQFPPAAPPYRALPGFGPHGSPGAWGGRLDVIHAVGRTGWSKNGAAREPRPCGALLSGQGSAARPCPLELFPGVVLCSCSRTMPGGGVAWGPWNPWNP